MKLIVLIYLTMLQLIAGRLNELTRRMQFNRSLRCSVLPSFLRQLRRNTKVVIRISDDLIMFTELLS